MNNTNQILLHERFWTKTFAYAKHGLAYKSKFDGQFNKFSLVVCTLDLIYGQAWELNKSKPDFIFSFAFTF